MAHRDHFLLEAPFMLTASRRLEVGKKKFKISGAGGAFYSRAAHATESSRETAKTAKLHTGNF